MAKDELAQITESTIRNGGLLARLYFDIQDKDKEKLQPLLVDLLNNRLLKENGVVYGYGKINEPIENEGLFVTSATITVLFKSLGTAANIMLNYAPVAVEVLQPETEMHIKMAEVQSILIDLSNVSIAYSKYILEKVLTNQDKEMILKEMKNRAELGKMLLESKGKKDDESQGKN